MPKKKFCACPNAPGNVWPFQTDRALQRGDGLPHVAVRHLVQRLHRAVGHRDTLCAADFANALCEAIALDRPKPELGAPGCQRADDSADVVADEAEASDFGIRLHRPAKSVLGILGESEGMVFTLALKEADFCINCTNMKPCDLQYQWPATLYKRISGMQFTAVCIFWHCSQCYLKPM